MKKITIALFLAFIFASACGGGGGEKVDATLDSDFDGIPDVSDEYPFDTDNDGVANDQDDDDDGDGISDADDAFPYDETENLDTDGDGKGNNLDSDDDGDGVADAEDIFSLNGDEWGDCDADEIGDNADPDDDGDTIPDTVDTSPLNPALSGDIDGDGTDNLLDEDDDGDGYSDTLERDEGSDPFGSASTPIDTDGDGLTNSQEASYGTDPGMADTDSDGLDDLLELREGLNPASSDTDGDSKDDGREYADGEERDYDGDGIADVLDFNHLIAFAPLPLDCGEITDRFGMAFNNEGDIVIARNDNDEIEVYSIRGEKLFAFGSGHLDKPNDVAVDGEGNYFVANTGAGNIVMFGSNGEFSRIIGGFGVELGEFSYPRGIDIDEDGYLYIADTENNRIGIMKGDGSGAMAFGGLGQGAVEFSAPVDVAIGGGGYIYVADRGNYRVQKFKKGLPLTLAGSIDYSAVGLGKAPDFEPVSLSVSGDGTLYILNSAEPYIFVVPPDGGAARSFGAGGVEEGEYVCPSGLELGGDDKVLIGETFRIQIF